MAEWNSRRLSALLATNIDSLVLAAVRDGKSAELEAFSNNLARQAKLAPAQPDQINLKVVTQDDNEIYFKCKQTTPLQKLMHAFCNRQGVSTNSVVFCFNGNRINETQTPQQLDMEDGDRIHVRREQMGGMMHPTSGRLNYEDLASQRRRVTLTPYPNPNPTPYPNQNFTLSPNHNQVRDAALARRQHPGGRRRHRGHLVLRAQAEGGCSAGARSGGQGGGRL